MEPRKNGNITNDVIWIEEASRLVQVVQGSGNTHLLPPINLHIAGDESAVRGAVEGEQIQRVWMPSTVSQEFWRFPGSHECREMASECTIQFMASTEFDAGHIWVDGKLIQ
jgi:hypothetical protein